MHLLVVEHLVCFHFIGIKVVYFVLLWNVSWICMAFLCRSSANLLYYFNFFFVSLVPKQAWHTSFCMNMFSFLLGIYLGMELLAHMAILCLTTWETARLFSKVAASFYNPTGSVWSLQFLLILTMIYLSFWLAILVTVKWVSHCDLICFSLMVCDIEHLCLLAICILFVEMSPDPLPIFNWLICLFIIEL